MESCLSLALFTSASCYEPNWQVWNVCSVQFKILYTLNLEDMWHLNVGFEKYVNCQWEQDNQSTEIRINERINICRNQDDQKYMLYKLPQELWGHFYMTERTKIRDRYTSCLHGEMSLVCGWKIHVYWELYNIFFFFSFVG